MRLGVLFATAGAVVLLGLIALQRQLSRAATTTDSPALDIVREITVSGASSLVLIVPLGLAIALVLGVLAVGLGSFKGGVGR